MTFSTNIKSEREQTYFISLTILYNYICDCLKQCIKYSFNEHCSVLLLHRYTIGYYHRYNYEPFVIQWFLVYKLLNYNIIVLCRYIRMFQTYIY